MKKISPQTFTKSLQKIILCTIYLFFSRLWKHSPRIRGNNRLHAVCFSLENQKGNTVKWGLKCVRGTKARKERARKNRLRTLLHFLRISVSPATEKLIGQCAHSKVARAQWRYGSYVLASTRQRSVLFHKVSLRGVTLKGGPS